MRKHLRTLLVTGAAIALGLGASPAFAAPFNPSSWTVTNPNAGGTYSASAVGSTVLTDPAQNGHGQTVISCSSSTANGSLPSGTIAATAPSTAVGNTSPTFSGCTGPVGPVTVTTNSTPYTIRAVDYDPVAGTGGAGLTRGYIGPVNVHVTTFACQFDVTGHAPGTYDNGNRQLRLSPTVALPAGVAGLRAVNVFGCAGRVANGDVLQYAATYQVSTSIRIVGNP